MLKYKFRAFIPLSYSQHCQEEIQTWTNYPKFHLVRIYQIFFLPSEELLFNI